MHGLITRGADALYDLSPFEFSGLFSPLLAALGDAETMEGWLASTQILAEVDLHRDPSRPSLGSLSNGKQGGSDRKTAERLERARNRSFSESKMDSKGIPVRPGSAFS